MKKKLTMLLLALVIAFGGTSVAMLSGCGSCDDTPPGPTETQYTVKFVGEDGTEIDSVTVQGGETVTAPAVPAKPGYTGKWVDADGNDADFTKGVTADAQYKAQYTANTDTEYTVEYYYETVEGGQYEKDDSKTETKTGTTDTTATVTATAEEGFEAATGVGEVLSGTIAGDGSLVLKVYYNRERYTVTFEADGETIDTKEVLYGGKVAATEEEVPSKDKTESTEYAFTHWSATEDGPAYNFDTTVTSNMTLYACYTQQTRYYEVDADLENELYYFTDSEGNDAEFPPVEYGTTVWFKVEATQEAAGTPVVKVVKTDDAGSTTTDTLTAAEDGMYSFVVDKESKIEVEGLTAREYNLSINVVEFEYEPDWANPYENVSDVMIEVNDGENARTFENAWTGDRINITLTAGDYTVRAFVENNSDRKYISEAIKVSVNSFYADEDDNIAASDSLLIATPMTIETSNAYKEESGAIRTDDGAGFNATYTGFAPGSADFAVTVTYDQIMDEPEHRPHENAATADPSIGFTFLSGDNKVELPLFDAGAFRVFENGTQMFEHRSTLAAAGSLMGKLEWPDCFRHATLTYVKTNGWLYVIISANGDAGGFNLEDKPIGSSAPTYVEYVPAMINLSTGEVYVVRGLGSNFPSYNTAGYYKSTVIPAVFNNVTSVFFECFYPSGTQSYVRASAYAYTMDETVLAEYDAKLRSVFSVTSSEELPTLTVDGSAYQGEEVLTVQQTRTIQFTLPENRIVDTITVGGQQVTYELNDDVVKFNVSTENNNLGPKNVVITLKEGVYADETTFTGTISVEGAFEGKDSLDNVMIRFISEGGAIVKGTYNSADHTYTATLPAGNYTAYASNGQLMGTNIVISGSAVTSTLNLVLKDYATNNAIVVNNSGLSYNAADGSLTVRKNVGGVQESAIAGFSFRPDSEVLEFGYTMTGMTNNGSLYPFMGMFVQSADGGIMRFVWAEAGDELRLLTKNHDQSRLALTDIAGGGLGGVQGWLPFGAPSGYYTFSKADYRLSVRVRIDGYNMSVWFKTGTDTEWKGVQFDDGTNTINVYDRYNQDTHLAMAMGDDSNRRINYLGELYSLDEQCVFGISARRDVSNDNVNVANFSDIWFNITQKA